MNAKRDYKPGTLARVDVDFGEQGTISGVLALRINNLRSDFDALISWVLVDGHQCAAEVVKNIRPLVVLDLDGSPEPATLLRFVGKMLDDGRSGYEREAQWLAGLAEQIEAQTKPAMPAEPTGLGAVVRGRDGREFVRVCSRHPGDDGYDWRADGAFGSDSSNRAWRDIDAVEVLHEGHQSGWYDRGAVLQRGGTS